MSTTKQEERDVIARWDHRKERIFIRLMAEEMKKVNQPFSKNEWNNIQKKFYTQTGFRYKHQQFKNKFQRLRLHFKEFNRLRNFPNSFTKKNPYANHFRKKGCPMFDELMVIYGDTSCVTARGRKAGAFSHGALDIDNDDDDDDGDDDDDDANINVDVNDDVIILDDDNVPYEEVAEDINSDADIEDSVRPKQSCSLSPTSRGVRESSNGAFADARRAFTLIQQRKYASSPLNAKDDPYSIKRCCELLSAIDVNDDMYVKALRMFQDHGWRETFVSVPAEKRVLLLSSLD